jgi:hypothetical protein
MSTRHAQRAQHAHDMHAMCAMFSLGPAALLNLGLQCSHSEARLSAFPCNCTALQGDGTAAIFQGRPDVFTLSVHADSNFPARKQVGAGCARRCASQGQGSGRKQRTLR